MWLSANLSLLFRELALVERFAAAGRHGFKSVEIQFPYAENPVALKQAAGSLPIDLINLPAGDPDNGDVSLSTDASRRAQFREGVETGLRTAEILGCRKVNILCGAPPAGQPDSVTHAVLVENARLAADRLSQFGMTVMIEPVNPFDVKGYWLDSLQKALDTRAQADHPSLRIQFDFYHMARTEPDLVAAIEATAHHIGHHIGHVQFADHPGRHEPGTGTTDFAAAVAALHRVGYDGALSAEYHPRAGTIEGLGWMPSWQDWLSRTVRRELKT